MTGFFGGDGVILIGRTDDDRLDRLLREGGDGLPEILSSVSAIAISTSCGSFVLIIFRRLCWMPGSDNFESW